MAAPPKPRRLDAADLPTLPKDEAERLTLALNTFQTEVESALSGRLTFGENISSQLKTLDFTTGTPASGSFPQVFKSSFSSRPAGVLLVNVVLPDAPANLATQTLSFPPWSFSNGNISILGLPGAQDATRYQLTFLVIGG